MKADSSNTYWWLTAGALAAVVRIQRSSEKVGSSKTIKAAWVRFPELTVVKADQTYTRLDEFTYRYASGDFEAELTVDDENLVAAYAEWARTGVAIGQGDTEPLDQR